MHTDRAARRIQKVGEAGWRWLRPAKLDTDVPHRPNSEKAGRVATTPLPRRQPKHWGVDPPFTRVNWRQSHIGNGTTLYGVVGVGLACRGPSMSVEVPLDRLWAPGCRHPHIGLSMVGCVIEEWFGLSVRRRPPRRPPSMVVDNPL
jgi:hypothetical protein